MSQNNGLNFRSKPLVRSGDTFYYGDPNDKYIVYMTVKTKKKVGDLELPDKVDICLMDTDPNVSKRRKVVKTTQKEGLYRSIDIAEAWLKRYLRTN